MMSVFSTAKFFNPVTEGTTPLDYFTRFLPEVGEFLKGLDLSGYFHGSLVLPTASAHLLQQPQEVNDYKVFYSIYRDTIAKEFNYALAKQHNSRPNSHSNYQLAQFPPGPGPHTPAQIQAERTLIFINETESLETFRRVDANFAIPANANNVMRATYLRNAANNIPGSIVTPYTSQRTINNAVVAISVQQRAQAAGVNDLSFVDNMNIFKAEADRLALIRVPARDPIQDPDELQFYKANLPAAIAQEAKEAFSKSKREFEEEKKVFERARKQVAAAISITMPGLDKLQNGAHLRESGQVAQIFPMLNRYFATQASSTDKMEAFHGLPIGVKYDSSKPCAVTIAKIQDALAANQMVATLNSPTRAIIQDKSFLSVGNDCLTLTDQEFILKYGLVRREFQAEAVFQIMVNVFASSTSIGSRLQTYSIENPVNDPLKAPNRKVTNLILLIASIEEVIGTPNPKGKSQGPSLTQSNQVSSKTSSSTGSATLFRGNPPGVKNTATPKGGMSYNNMIKNTQSCNLHPNSAHTSKDCTIVQQGLVSASEFEVDRLVKTDTGLPPYNYMKISSKTQQSPSADKNKGKRQSDSKSDHGGKNPKGDTSGQGQGKGQSKSPYQGQGKYSNAKDGGGGKDGSGKSKNAKQVKCSICVIAQGRLGSDVVPDSDLCHETSTCQRNQLAQTAALAQAVVTELRRGAPLSSSRTAPDP